MKNILIILILFQSIISFSQNYPKIGCENNTYVQDIQQNLQFFGDSLCIADDLGNKIGSCVHRDSLSREHTGIEGSLFFAGADNKPTENNPKLHWDIGDERLGLHTATPEDLLHIKTTSSEGITIGTQGNTTSFTQLTPYGLTLQQFNGGPFIDIDAFDAKGINGGGTLSFFADRGVAGSPLAMHNRDVMGAIRARGTHTDGLSSQTTGGIIHFITDGDWNGSSNAPTNLEIALKTSGDASTTTKLTVQSTGQMKFNDYGSGNFIEPISYNLGVTSLGHVVEINQINIFSNLDYYDNDADAILAGINLKEAYLYSNTNTDGQPAGMPKTVFNIIPASTPIIFQILLFVFLFFSATLKTNAQKITKVYQDILQGEQDTLVAVFEIETTDILGETIIERETRKYVLSENQLEKAVAKIQKKREKLEEKLTNNDKKSLKKELDNVEKEVKNLTKELEELIEKLEKINEKEEIGKEEELTSIATRIREIETLIVPLGERKKLLENRIKILESIENQTEEYKNKEKEIEDLIKKTKKN